MSITWNENWILPYESTWSILEKVKFANQVSTKQLIQIFGTEDSKKIRNGKVGKLRCGGSSSNSQSLALANVVVGAHDGMLGAQTHSPLEERVDHALAARYVLLVIRDVVS